MEIDPSSPADSPVKESNRPDFNFNSLRQIIFQPAQAFAGVVAHPKKAWLTPVILVLVLVVGAALASTQSTSRTSATSGNTRLSSAQATAQATRTTNGSSKTSGNSGSSSNQGGGPVIIQGGPGGPPPDFGGGAVFFDGGGPVASNGTTTTSGGTTATASTQNIGLALLSPAATFLLTWLLLGVLTNILSLGFGGHGNAGMALTVAAWSSIPAGVRSLMQLFYYLASGSSISAPGLSGFAPTANGDNWLILLQQLLSHVDLYLFWQIGLLAVGVSVWGGLARKKAWTIAVLGIGLVLILQSLIGLGLDVLGGMNLNIGTLLRLR